jgi:hypothetical protein
MSMCLKTTEINIESNDFLKSESRIDVVIDSEKLPEFLALLTMIPLHYSGHKFCRIIHQNLGVRK